MIDYLSAVQNGELRSRPHNGLKGEIKLKRWKKRNLLWTLTLCILLFAAGCSAEYEAGREKQVIPSQEADTTEKAGADSAPESYTAVIAVADYGSITLTLDRTAAPATVANFVALARDGFYDGLRFHRIIDGFMIQGGDPNGNGTGGSGKTVTGEFSANGFDNPLSHTRGAISMARSSDYNSASSQFFIVHEDSTYLDGNYAVFGYVTDGMDVVDAICANAKPTDNNGSIAADAQPVITSITIAE